MPTRPRHITQRRSFAIVAAQGSGDWSRELADGAMRELDGEAPGSSISVYEVPGVFEIPLFAQFLAERGGVDAILALGILIHDEAGNAERVAWTVVEALQQTILKFRIPIIHGVVILRDEAEARERCTDAEKNPGIEAARLALRVMQALSESKIR